MEKGGLLPRPSKEEQMEWVEGGTGSEVKPSGAEKYVRLRREETQNVMHSLTGNTFGLQCMVVVTAATLPLCAPCAGRRGMKNSCLVGRSDLSDREGHISARNFFWRNHRDMLKADETKAFWRKESRNC